MKIIATADVHLRGTPPPCRRNDDWMSTQMALLNFLSEQCKKHKASLVIAGDLFHSANIKKEAEKILIRWLTRSANQGVRINVIPGNHGMRYQIHQSNTSYDLISSFPWESAYFANQYQTPFDFPYYNFENYQMAHVLTSPGDSVFDAMSPKELLDKTGATLLIVGDNHSDFVYEDEGRLLISPGTPIRQKRNEVDYKPVVYLIDTDTQRWETIPVPEFGIFDLTEGKKEGINLENEVLSIINSIPEQDTTIDFQEIIKEGKATLSEPQQQIIEEIQNENNNA